ncbi:Arginine ABC transporter permease protein ArtQ [Paraburkholderia piptadeniae]|uniref:ABC transporter permease subunit n=2 Tax=Paraburkholderia TaxID=1822464 RepID=A0A7X1NEF6_9BURK|nr:MULTISPECIES: ABC transporter permease subunit [Paraburkholderia]MPW20410.1 ABC transporter permease subunit [Paraburkholderia franconis]SIT50958.1 Arginine ABC transporter permease protein ArtQ [Paraburkholderia piptadeniae]
MNPLLLYGAQLAQGALVTLKLAVCVLVLGLSSGLVLAWLKGSRHRFVRVPVDIATSIIRGIPEFLIILVIYFGLSMLADNFGGALEITPFMGGVIALAIVVAVFSSEIYRGAFAAVPKGQLEAADAYGVSKIATFMLIRLPQAWRICLPSINNMWQSVIKDTSLVSVIGLEDMLKKADIAAQYTRQPMLFYCAAAVIYFLMLTLSVPLFRHLEMRASRGYTRG